MHSQLFGGCSNWHDIPLKNQILWGVLKASRQLSYSSHQADKPNGRWVSTKRNQASYAAK